MTQALSLTITPRAQTGRSASRRVRKVNQIPAILYGKHTNPQTIAIDAPEFTRLLKSVAGRALIIELNRKDSADKALSFVQEIQRDPITDKFLHVDLQEVKANEKLEINVPISIVGEAYGIKTQGGVLETSTHTLRVRCLPKDLPPLIEIDVTDLKINESLKVAGLKAIAGVEFRDAPGQPVVGVLSIAAEEVATPAAGAAAGAATAAAGAAAPAAGAAAKPGDAKAAAGAKPGDAKAAAPAAKPAAKK
ncbi:5S rRNA E-loop-binding protein [Verrucomicrobia bacterium IMCC26134]|jgi:large subunit ribosomal protein L25|nr:5S rRNA E-loop-binding protein [Verrucomicrobia bacterium IMCC26134]